jgi:VanZ family protein
MIDRILLFVARAALLISLILSTYSAVAAGGPVAGAEINDKFLHLAGFYLLALLADFSFPRRAFDIYKILPLIAYGLVIEIIQFYLPYRSCSILDLVADGAGLMLYSLTFLMLRYTPLVDRRAALPRK